MAQATLDADVLDSETDDQKSSTDELLSRLAGEEIDHLLAEADAGRTTSGGTAAPRAVVAAPVAAPAETALVTAPSHEAEDDAALAAQMDATLGVGEEAAGGGKIGAAPESPAADAGMGASTSEAELAAQLDSMLAVGEGGAVDAAVAKTGVPAESVAAPDVAVEAAAPPVVVATAAIEAAVAAEQASRAAEAAEEARLDTLAAELEVSGTTSVADEELGVHSFTSPEEEAGEPEGEVPWILKPLILINKPVLGYPDALRSLLGKAAILTFINAAGVLAYVAIFRKH